LFAGGRSPKRAPNTKQEWHIHHVYDGKFPWTNGRETLHAVQDGKHVTQSAGLVAIHPIAEALADEYLRESFLRFNYDPDMVFSKKTDAYGLKIS